MRGVRWMAVVAPLLLAVGACTLFVDTGGLAEEATPASDAGGVTSADSGPPIDAGRRPDAGAADASLYCDGVDAAFCADFDRPELVNFGFGSMLGECKRVPGLQGSSSQCVSAPSQLASLFKTVEISGDRVVANYAVRIDTTDSTRPDLTKLTLGACRLILTFYATDTLSFYWSSPAGGGTITTSFKPPAGTWTSMREEVDFSGVAPQVTVRAGVHGADGALQGLDVIAVGAMSQDCAKPATVAFGLGVTSSPTNGTGWSLTFDNATVDAR